MNPTKLAASLLKAAMRHTGLSCAAILGKRRPVALCEARWACWVILRDHKMTFSEIGRLFNRDHRAVMHGVKMARKRMIEPGFARLCATVRDHDSARNEVEQIGGA
jgi:chromosomal replication initiation ATPase DnaA